MPPPRESSKCHHGTDLPTAESSIHFSDCILPDLLAAFDTAFPPLSLILVLPTWLKPALFVLTPFCAHPTLSLTILVFHTSKCCVFRFISFFKLINLFLERAREREREGEKHRCVVASCAPPTGPATQARALIGNQTGDPLVHSLCSIH